MKSSDNLDKKIPSDIYWRVQLVYENLGSQFLRTITGIQSGQGACDKSKLIMTFLTNWCELQG